MPSKNIRNIIFDFGGVIIDIDFGLSINAFNQLGAANFEEKYSKISQSLVFDELDKGIINENEFCEILKQYLSAGVSNSQVLNAWNAILIGIPEHRIRLLENVGQFYRIFLFSNTNIIHYPVYIQELKTKFGYEKLDDLFEKVYLSFETGMRKPEEEFYRLILSENQLQPSETIFIDDSEHNLMPARLLGMKTLHLTKGKDISEYFDDYKLIY